jgi:hypothetical protein
MFLIRTVWAYDGVHESTIELAGPDDEPQGQYWTLIVGENGTRKSGLLRAVAEQYIAEWRGKPVLDWSSSGHYERRLVARLPPGPPPRRLFAIAPIANDKFPRLGKAQLVELSDRYCYLGNMAGNVSSHFRPFETLISSLALNDDSLHDLDRKANEVVVPIGLSGPLEFFLGVAPRREIPDEQILALEGDRIDQALAAKNLSHLRSAYLAAPGGRTLMADILGAARRGPRRGFKFVLSELADPTFRTCIAVLFGIGVAKIDEVRIRRDQAEFGLSDGSSGERYLVATLTSLRLLARNDSLLLIDEPETSLHPRWQLQFFELLELALSEVSGCHVVLATHSPTIAAGLPDQDASLVALRRGQEGELFSKTIGDTPFGRNADQILIEVFGAPSSRNSVLVRDVNSALELLSQSRSINSELRGRLHRYRTQLSQDDPAFEIVNAIVDSEGRSG